MLVAFLFVSLLNRQNLVRSSSSDEKFSEALLPHDGVEKISKNCPFAAHLRLLVGRNAFWVSLVAN